MNCPQLDLKAYFLDELAESDRRLVADHLVGCHECREELERLQLTRASLATLRDEEIPRRIGFVSDKVFEPRGWRWLWNSVPRLAFASAALLSFAILVHAFLRPAPVVHSPGVDTAALEARIEAEVTRRLDSSLQKTIAEHDARQTQKMSELVSGAENRLDRQSRAGFLAVQENIEYMQKKIGVYQRAATGAIQ
jgi:anti-sigma factor RsiW